MIINIRKAVKAHIPHIALAFGVASASSLAALGMTQSNEEDIESTAQKITPNSELYSDPTQDLLGAEKTPVSSFAIATKPSFTPPKEGEPYPLNEMDRLRLAHKYSDSGYILRYNCTISFTTTDLTLDYKTPKEAALARKRFDEYTEKYSELGKVIIPTELLESTFISQEIEKVNGYANLIIAVPESMYQPDAKEKSTLNLMAFNKGTKARGPYQFIPSTGLARIYKASNTDAAELFPESSQIATYQRKNMRGERVTAYYIPKDKNKPYARGNRDYAMENEVLENVYFDTLRSSILMAQNLKANTEYYVSKLPEGHTLTINDAHSTHFRGSGGAVKFYWRHKNTPDDPAYTMYAFVNKEGEMDDGRGSPEVRKNMPVFSYTENIDGEEKTIWRSYAQVKDYYIDKGMTDEPIRMSHNSTAPEIKIPAFKSNETSVAKREDEEHDVETNTYASILQLNNG